MTKLLHAIAKVVGYEIEQLDIMAGRYTPQGFYDNLQRQQEIQAATSGQWQGCRSIPSTRPAPRVYPEIDLDQVERGHVLGCQLRTARRHQDSEDVKTPVADFAPLVQLAPAVEENGQYRRQGRRVNNVT